MEAEYKYEIVAEVYKCLLKCDSFESQYSFILRIGDKLSAESTKRTPLSENAIEFNERSSLEITELDKSRAINCEILLFQHKNNDEKSIAGIASVPIEDLRLKQKRPCRLLNSFDKRASIQLSIYQEDIIHESYKSSRFNRCHLKSRNQSNFKNLAVNQLHPSRFSQDKFMFMQRKYDQNLSRSSGTKTCPHYLEKSNQLTSQRKFSRKRQSNHSNNSSLFNKQTSLFNMQTSLFNKQTSLFKNETLSDFDKSKNIAESSINYIEKRASSIKDNFFIQENPKHDNENRIAQTRQKVQCLGRLYSQNMNSIDQVVQTKKNNVQNKKKGWHLSIRKSVNEFINIKKASNLKSVSGLIQFSINFDQRRRIPVDRAVNTEQKISCDYGTITDQNEVNSQRVQTPGLRETLDKEMQTIQRMSDLSDLKQIIQNKQLFSIKPMLSSQMDNNKMTQTSQQDNKVKQAEQVLIRKELNLNREQSSQFQDEQLYQMRLSIHSQNAHFKQQSLRNSISQYSPTAKSSSNHQNTQKLQINKTPKNQLITIQPQSNLNFDCSLDYSPFKQNQCQNQSITSLQNPSHFFVIVKTVELRVRSLKQTHNKSLWSNIKTTQNPKSKLQKIGFIKKNDLPPYCPTIEQINESLQESHELSNIKFVNSLKGNQVDEISKRKKHEQTPNAQINDNYEINIKINQEVSVIDISEIIQEEDQYFVKETPQYATFQYSNQKDIKTVIKQAKIIDETNQFQLKKANSFLQLTNVSIAQALKSTKDSFSTHIFDCKSNNVRKQDFIKVQKQLNQLQKQLRTVQLSKKRLNEEKFRLETQKQQCIKQIELLRKQNLKLTENFKTLKKQYHTFAFEVMEKETENQQKPNQKYSKKGNKTQTTQAFLKQITPSGQNQDIFTFTPSKWFKTQKQISEKQFEADEIKNSKIVKTQKNVMFSSFLGSDRKLSTESLSEMKTTRMKNGKSDRSVDRKQFGLFLQHSTQKSNINVLQSNYFTKKSRSQTLQKIHHKKTATGQTSYLSNFPSTIIEDFINQDRPPTITKDFINQDHPHK